MHPVLLEWHGLRVYSYPVLLYLGLVVGIGAGNYAANAAGLDAARVFIAMVLLTIPGLVGARLLFVATHWARYAREPGRIWRRSEGGAALQGGLLLAVVVSVPLLPVIEVPFGAFWDVATFTSLIWLIFTRIGCLLHGCCSGRPSEWPLALYLPDQRGTWRRRIPTQLLEIGWAALLLLGAVVIGAQHPLPGALSLCALAAYGIGRCALQPLRAAQDRLGALNLQQALAAALAALSVTGLLALWLDIARDAR